MVLELLELLDDEELELVLRLRLVLEPGLERALAEELVNGLRLRLWLRELVLEVLLDPPSDRPLPSSWSYSARVSGDKVTSED